MMATNRGSNFYTLCVSYTVARTPGIGAMRLFFLRLAP